MSAEQTDGSRRLRRHDPCGVVSIGRDTEALVPILGETEPLMRAVLDAVAAATNLADRHGGTVALAHRYATLIDAASPPARYRESMAAVGLALDELEMFNAKVATDSRKHFLRIVDALSAHSVASDLGPKLLAALAALGLTVAPAAVVPPRAGGVPNDSVTAVSALDQLRARRAQRTGAHGA